MDIKEKVITILVDALQLNRSVVFSEGSDNLLLGAIPEFDSIAVVSILTSIEDQFGFAVEDDEIVSDVFVSVSTLVEFVNQKLSG